MRAVRQPGKPTDWWSEFAVVFVALLFLLLLFFLTAIPLYGL
jgi:hypothetical protein